jgi:hypothetical protein
MKAGGSGAISPAIVVHKSCSDSGAHIDENEMRVYSGRPRVYVVVIHVFSCANNDKRKGEVKRANERKQKKKHKKKKKKTKIVINFRRGAKEEKKKKVCLPSFISDSNPGDDI